MADTTLREQISELIRQKAPPRLADAIEQSVRESLLLRTTPVPDGGMPVGRSRIGGMPDLPPEVEWPTWNDQPLAFIAQISLSELPPYEFLEVLPSTGVLSFFYSARQETWGFDPKDQSSWRVLHLDEQGLQRRSPSPYLPDEGIYQSCGLDYAPSFTLPCIESPHVDLDFDRGPWEGIDEYIELLKDFEQLVDEGRWLNRLLGHPDQMQNDMLLTAQWASHGLYCGRPDPAQAERERELEPGAADRQLLLQIDSDPNTGMMWGDVGKLYYLMHSEDLRNRNFDAAWLILQCT
ncbi:MAG: DUF1963 domain-containing protein [Armatimonadetes bacterium]|nr:DUF1963 domain-containing protein [Armatimonadota bacterium]